MTRSLDVTLVTDGTSDSVLRHCVSWLLEEAGVTASVVWADLTMVPPCPTLSGRIAAAVAAYPCSLLVVHRDAERDPREVRVQEITLALEARYCTTPAVCLVPVRMTEAWLLFDADAIRRAADNPRGRVRLQLPDLSDLENLPDPKDVLHSLLQTASELSGRRLKNFRPHARVHRVAELIRDWACLRSLAAFADFEKELVYAARAVHGYAHDPCR